VATLHDEENLFYQRRAQGEQRFIKREHMQEPDKKMQ
jgi:hypothetical protein